jgi:serine/threonine-protein kinase HipA
VPTHRLEQVNGRDVLLVERFDRHGVGARLRRHLMLTALTLLDLDDTEAALASYPALSEVLLRHAKNATADRHELFRRMVFNILVGNEDDQAKNHACFWDGRRLQLTPAYDLLPQRRAGMEGRQAMIVGTHGAGGRESTLLNALSSAGRFGLDRDEARRIAKSVLRVVESQWERRFRDYGVPRREIDSLRGTSVLSPLAVRLDG